MGCEPSQDEMNALDEVEESIEDIENLFIQRQSESVEINIGNTDPEGEDNVQDRIGAMEKKKDVKRIDVEGAVKEGDAKNVDELS
jgi:hypothetical protein